ncbi:alkaline phosphatase D family protein [Xylophilus ampelinus]|uniref:Alkaline phosphatase D n=1 Tax=Xylophilus ampelinus TaxID=54067 RepID=A0A318SJT0_9BURK|nr:alkaline phosphatase D family protein [Xylophilus ampelinus]MCS4509425.1 alkaline phosphatase D family protein [Xylophilus ampelinus]PYE79147.1 alkaline phosphatase D [Xylophilus ampelinus]
MDRRLWLRLAAALAATGTPPLRHALARGLRADPFACGVASGSPSEDGFVLWTRLDTAALPQPAAEVPVRWEIADDEGFRRIVRSGTAAALPALGHAVHVELAGLPPDRWFHYRFMAGDAVSTPGRTRTSPAAHTLAARLRFAFASCQRWEHGYYAAWRHLAAEQPDLVVFLGDYIYETATPRKPDRPLARIHALHRAVTLADYRDRYALHKSDPDLQAAHRACPWIVTWDDHEVENDYAGLHGRAAPADFLAQRGAAYQAFYENMPLRSDALVRGMAGLGTLGGVRVNERYAFGRLARFHVLDGRQFKDLQACRDPSRSSAGAVREDECPELQSPGRSFLGAAQERWLDAGLAEDAAGDATRWTVLAQQTLFSPRHYGPAGHATVPTDSWDGYPAARDRLIGAIAGHAPRNTVFVGGDIHQNYVCNLHADGARAAGPVIASEFCGTSVSSFSGTTQERVDALVRRNPQVVFADCEKRGYALADLTPRGWDTALRVVDDPARADSGIATLARFHVEDGRPGVHRG